MRKRRWKKKDSSRLTRISFLPSLFTTFNLLLGYLALQQILLSHFRFAIYLITASVIMDGFDGTIARLTKTESSFGVQLDSLTDAITFGLVPSVLIFAWGFPAPFAQIGKVIGFLYLSCGIMRLARFNVYKEADAFPPNIFIGLPIPTAALAVSSVVLIFSRSPRTWTYIILFALYCLLISYLMISNIHYKTVKTFILKNSLRTLFLLAVVVVLLIIYPTYTIPCVTFLYVLSPLPFRIFRRRVQTAERKVEAPAAKPGEPATPHE